MRQPFGQTLIAGDAWIWNVNVGDVGAAGGTLKYFFRGPSNQKLDLSSLIAADGSCQFNAISTDTAKLAGDLSWQLCVFDILDNRTELARGTVTVLADIQAAGQGFDGRSWNKRMLDAICAVLEGRASRVEKLYQIAGRHIELLTPDELLKLKGNLQSLYDRELVASGQKPSGSNQIRVAFGANRGTNTWR